MAHISSADLRAALTRKSPLPATFQNLDAQLIRCDIVFGMPSQDCRGTGICKISSDLLQSVTLNQDCRHTAAFVSQKDDGRQLAIVFFRELLCIHLFRHHFRKGMLEMAEPCPLPAELIADLGLQGAVLMPGKYRIHEYEGCFRVNITCGV